MKSRTIFLSLSASRIFRSGAFLSGALLSAIFLSGCGSEGSKQYPADRASLPPADIASFAVTGSAAAQQNTTPVNAGIDDGKFSIDWNVTTTGSFQLRLFLSQDNALSSEDVRIFNNGLCGNLSVNDCHTQDSFSCHFGADNTLKCTDGFATYDENLQTLGFLTALPQQAFIIGEVCVLKDCETATTKVEFQ